MKRKTGIYETTSVAGENVNAFIPYELPPARPKIKVSDELATLLQSAETNLARLETAGHMVPSLDWFVYALVRNEAVISSQIEGTQASLDDLLATSSHKLGRAGKRFSCTVCLSSFSMLDSSFRHWLSVLCPGYPTTTGQSGPHAHRPNRISESIHLGNQVSHVSHSLCNFQGVIYCSK